jgi:hypothetical protein
VADTQFYSSIAAHDDWDKYIMVLSTESSAQTSIYAFLTAMEKISRNNALTTDKYITQGQSYKALQAQIQKCLNRDPMVIFSALFLFGAEIFAGNITQATIHGKMLQACLYEKVQKEGFNAVPQSTWVVILSYDITFALLQLHRPILILENWILDSIKQIVRPADKFMESIQSNFTSNLDNTLDHDPLRRIFVINRQCAWFWTQPNPITKEDSESGLSHLSIGQWIITTTQILRAELLNHYIDMQLLLEQNASTSTKSSLNGKEIYYSTQCCLILGMLFFSNLSRGDPIISGQPLHGISKILLMHLHTTVSLILRTSFTVDSNIMEKYHNAHLWVLFIGAQAEQTDSKSYLDPSKAWFNVAFGSLARQMHLFTWTMIRCRLEQFIYHDALTPHPSTWVPKSLHVTLHD